MKFVTVLAFVSLASALDIGKLLGGLKPLLKKAKCVAPALVKAANDLKCDNHGPLATICANVDKIAKGSETSIKKCGIDKSTSDTVVKVIKNLCQENARRSLTGRQDPNSCSSCSADCQKNGCVADGDCDFCEAFCEMVCEK